MSKIRSVRSILLSSPYADPDDPEIKECFPNGAKRTIGMVELSTGLYYHGPWGLSNSYNRDLYARFNVSYVTGSHAFKAGVAYIDQWSNSPTIISSNLDYQFRTGLPVSIIEYATARPPIA